MIILTRKKFITYSIILNPRHRIRQYSARPFWTGFEVLTEVAVKRSVCYLLNASIRARLVFNPEDGGNISFRKVGRFWTDWSVTAASSFLALSDEFNQKQ
jgi:hypothetical protein